MELHKLKVDEVRSWDKSKLKETADELRLQLANLRMDIYKSKSQQIGKLRGLKRSLARVLTVGGESKKNLGKSK